MHRPERQLVTDAEEGVRRILAVEQRAHFRVCRCRLPIGLEHEAVSRFQPELLDPALVAEAAVTGGDGRGDASHECDPSLTGGKQVVNRGDAPADIVGGDEARLCADQVCVDRDAGKAGLGDRRQLGVPRLEGDHDDAGCSVAFADSGEVTSPVRHPGGHLREHKQIDIPRVGASPDSEQNVVEEDVPQAPIAIQAQLLRLEVHPNADKAPAAGTISAHLGLRSRLLDRGCAFALRSA